MRNPSLSIKTSSPLSLSTILSDDNLSSSSDKSQSLSPLTRPEDEVAVNEGHSVEIQISPCLDQSENSAQLKESFQNTQTVPPSRFLVFLTVSFYLVAALVMVFVNKWVLNSVPAPVFFLFCQLVIAVALLKITSMVGFFQVPMLNLGVFKSLIPLISINVCGLVFNTYCLQYVDTSFYQVARGLVLPSTVLASYLLLGIKSSPRIHLSTFVVCIGFMVGVSSERMTVSSLGVFLGILSSITTSLHAIAIKSSLNKVSTSTLELTYFTNLLSSVFVIPIVIITGEIPVIFNLFFGKVSIEASSQTIETGNSLNDYDLRTFVVGTLVTGFFGFLISLAGFLSIKVTSPVTHMISSAIRGVIQTALGALIFNDQITFGRLSGIVIILGGSIYYTFVKDQELYNKPNNSYYQPIKESQPMVELYKKEEIQSNVTAPRLEVAIEAAEEEQQGLIRGNQDKN